MDLSEEGSGDLRDGHVRRRRGPDRRARAPARASLKDVGDDADDLDLAGAGLEVDPHAGRPATVEVGIDEGLVHHGHRGRIGAVGLGEAPAVAHRDVERLEEAGGHVHEVGETRGAGAVVPADTERHVQGPLVGEAQRHRGVAHVGKVAQIPDGAVEEARGRLGVGVARVVEGQLHGGHATGIEPGLEGGEVSVAAGEEHGSEEEDGHDRHLPHEEGPAHGPPGATDNAARAAHEESEGVGPAELGYGHDTEDEGGQEREPEGDGEGPSVEGHRLRGAEVRPEEELEAAEGQRRDAQAEGPAEKTEHGVLGEQLADQRARAATEGPAGRHLRLAGDGPGYLDTGQVGTTHQDQQADRAEEHEQRQAQPRRERVFEGDQAEAPRHAAGASGRRLDRREASPRLLPRHSFGEPDQGVVVRPAPFAGGGGAQGRPHVRRLVGTEALRHDAHDRVQLPLQTDRPPQDRGIGAEALGPQPVAQNRDRGAVRHVLGRRELTAHERGDAQRGEEAGADPLLQDEPRGLVGREVHALHPSGVHGRLEAVGFVTNPNPGGSVHAHLPLDTPALRVVEAGEGQALGVGVRERTPQHRVHGAEDGGAEPDAESQGQDERPREDGAAGHGAEREPDVAGGLVEPGRVGGAPGSCAHRLGSPEAAARVRPSGPGWHSLRHEILRYGTLPHTWRDEERPPPVSPGAPRDGPWLPPRPTS